MLRGRPRKGAPKTEATVYLTVRRFPRRLRDALSGEAARRGVTAAELVRIAVAKEIGVPVEVPAVEVRPPAGESPSSSSRAASRRPGSTHTTRTPGGGSGTASGSGTTLTPGASQVISVDARGCGSQR